MKRTLAAALVLLSAGAAFAQTSTAPSGTSTDSSVMSNGTMNNSDAALPGASESGTAGSMSSGSSTTPPPPVTGSGGGVASTPLPEGTGAAEPAQESTPSGGIVPGQTPE